MSRKSGFNKLGRQREMRTERERNRKVEGRGEYRGRQREKHGVAAQTNWQINRATFGGHLSAIKRVQAQQQDSTSCTFHCRNTLRPVDSTRSIAVGFLSPFHFLPALCLLLFVLWLWVRVIVSPARSRLHSSCICDRHRLPNDSGT